MPVSETFETIVCPHCGAANRAPAERLAQGEAPNCGSCHQPLFAAEPREVESVEEFDRIVGHTTLPVLIDFWAPWCGPCRAMAPAFHAAAKALEPGVRLLKVNTDELPKLAGRFGIRGIPTLILVHGGKEVARRSGALDLGAIKRWVGETLAAQTA